MEMSFHTTADRGEHSSHFNQGDGNGGISGPGTAPRGLFSWYLPLHFKERGHKGSGRGRPKASAFVSLGEGVIMDFL